MVIHSAVVLAAKPGVSCPVGRYSELLEVAFPNTSVLGIHFLKLNNLETMANYLFG